MCVDPARYLESCVPDRGRALGFGLELLGLGFGALGFACGLKLLGFALGIGGFA